VTDRTVGYNALILIKASGKRHVGSIDETTGEEALNEVLHGAS
jgi:hypothetical protein